MSLIDREAAIDAAIEAVDDWDGGYNLTRADMIADAINNTVPSAQPEREKGKWVGCDGDCLKTMCKCSECGAMIDINEKYRNFFCYHCGARMDGERGMTDDLISREAALEALNGINGTAETDQAFHVIEALSSAQPDPSQTARDIATIIENEKDMRAMLKQPDIIACADCKHWICHDRRCGYWNHGVKPLDWCCHAERKENRCCVKTANTFVSTTHR